MLASRIDQQGDDGKVVLQFRRQGYKGRNFCQQVVQSRGVARFDESIVECQESTLFNRKILYNRPEGFVQFHAPFPCRRSTNQLIESVNPFGRTVQGCSPLNRSRERVALGAEQKAREEMTQVFHVLPIL